MTRISGRELARRAYRERFAVPAFNVSNMECVQAVIAAAERSRAPVFLQVSPGVIEYAGFDMITEIVFHAAERAAIPAAAHLDHCRDPELVRLALDRGYDSVMFDGSMLSFEENVGITADLAKVARGCGAGIEAELGVIGGIEDTSPSRALEQMTTVEEAISFVRACEVDLLAAAIGSVHRMPDDAVSIDLDRIAAISSAIERPLALHGGSGVARRQLSHAIANGVGKVNISSRMSRSLAGGIREAWASDPSQLDLRRFLGAGRAAVEAMAVEYFELCGASGRADSSGTSAQWTANVQEAE